MTVAGCPPRESRHSDGAPQKEPQIIAWSTFNYRYCAYTFTYCLQSEHIERPCHNLRERVDRFRSQGAPLPQGPNWEAVEKTITPGVEQQIQGHDCNFVTTLCDLPFISIYSKWMMGMPSRVACSPRNFPVNQVVPKSFHAIV